MGGEEGSCVLQKELGGSRRSTVTREWWIGLADGEWWMWWCCLLVVVFGVEGKLQSMRD